MERRSLNTNKAMSNLRNYLLAPIPELFTAAKLLHQAAVAHKNDDREAAATLIAQADADPLGFEDWDGLTLILK